MLVCPPCCPFLGTELNWTASLSLTLLFIGTKSYLTAKKTNVYACKQPWDRRFKSSPKDVLIQSCVKLWNQRKKVTLTKRVWGIRQSSPKWKGIAFSSLFLFFSFSFSSFIFIFLHCFCSFFVFVTLCIAINTTPVLFLFFDVRNKIERNKWEHVGFSPLPCFPPKVGLFLFHMYGFSLSIFTSSFILHLD